MSMWKLVFGSSLLPDIGLIRAEYLNGSPWATRYFLAGRTLVSAERIRSSNAWPKALLDCANRSGRPLVWRMVPADNEGLFRSDRLVAGNHQVPEAMSSMEGISGHPKQVALHRLHLRRGIPLSESIPACDSVPFEHSRQC
jgi:hypothetical protein